MCPVGHYSPRKRHLPAALEVSCSQCGAVVMSSLAAPTKTYHNIMM